MTVVWGLPILLAYGWIFWLLGSGVDLFWRLVCKLFEPALRVFGRASALAYGPSIGRLDKLLGGSPILLLTARNDEADLLLQAGCAPSRLYREYIAARYSKVAQFAELLFVRPLVIGAALPVLGMLLQKIVLGFPAWRTLFFEYVVAPGSACPYRASCSLLHRELEVAVARGEFDPEHLSPSLNKHDVPSEARRVDLHASITEVIAEIKRQVRLRHSGYYESEEVLSKVVEYLTAEHAAPRSNPVDTVEQASG